MKPKGGVKIKWSPNLAYAIGLLVTDGNLSSDGRHIDFTSKDHEQVLNFVHCLGVDAKIGNKTSGSSNRKYFRVQIGDVIFYKFLLGIGLTPRKSKTIAQLKIPRKYLFDFLRGHFDGDGSFYSYFDPRWKSSFMFYFCFTSASPAHIKWLQDRIFEFIKIKGHLTKSIHSSVYQLKYAKKEALKLIKKLYYNEHVICLSRKKTKIESSLSLNNRVDSARVVKLVYTQA